MTSEWLSPKREIDGQGVALTGGKRNKEIGGKPDTF